MTAATPHLSPFFIPLFSSPSVSARLPGALRVNHVRQADPLIKTGLHPFLLLLLLEELSAGHSGNRVRIDGSVVYTCALIDTRGRT